MWQITEKQHIENTETLTELLFVIEVLTINPFKMLITD